MKKIMVMTLCVIFALGVSTASFAIEFSASQADKVPSSYAKVKGDKVVFGKKPTAYSPGTLNRILNAYGVFLQAGDIGGIQAVSYASVKDGKPVFGTKATAYSPNVLHSILTAYGNDNGKLYITVDAINALSDPPNYAKIKNGKPVFGTKATAYSPEEWNMLMGAYQLPEPGAPQPPPVVTEDTPVTPTPVTPTPIVEGPCPDEDRDGVCDDVDQCPGTPVGALVDRRGCWIVQNLLFDFDKAIIKRQYYGDLDRVVEVLRGNPSMRVEIQGHTCNLGSKKYNKRLSDRRAKAVRDYFLKRGVNPSRLTWMGYGEARPAFPNTNRENRRMNRRVELTPKP